MVFVSKYRIDESEAPKPNGRYIGYALMKMRADMQQKEVIFETD